MGFFKSLFRSSKKADKPAKKATEVEAQVRPTGANEPITKLTKHAAEPKEARYALVLEGDEERTVYTYDAAPLKGTRKGSVFYADVITSPMRLYSRVTGSEWDSSSGGVALAVNGQPFGMTNTLDQTFRDLASIGYSIKVKVKRQGMYCEGIPQLVLQIPHPSEVFHWRDACRGLGKEIPFEHRHSEESDRAAELEEERVRLSRNCGRQLPIGVSGDVFFFNDEEWIGPKPQEGIAQVDVSTSLIPTPKGSKAKPHVSFFVSGEQASELSARNRQYNVMSKHVGETPYLATCQKFIRDNDTFCWRVTVVFYSQEG